MANPALPDLTSDYWNQRYEQGHTGWDMGQVSPPIRTFIDGLTDKDLRILMPGCGKAYEGEYFHRQGFRQVHLMDFAPEAQKAFAERVPDFPAGHWFTGDFFQHQGEYDIIIEQTFFCALNPSLRPRYVEHMHHLLVPGGRLVGLLFNAALNTEHPPFGGFKADYHQLFQNDFQIQHLDTAANSIPPRQGRELWIDFQKV
ncbi:MAG: methyltransferase domain-containing protein [Salibacteraceae bacterium]